MTISRLCAAVVVGLTVSSAWAGEFAPAPIVTVQGEATHLAAERPRVWAEGTRLRELQTIRPGVGTPAHHAVVPESIVVRLGDRVLEKGKDYLADPVWGSIGVSPGSTVKPSDPVTVDYRYSLRRIDSRIKTADGRTIIRAGKPELTVPQPPPLEPGETRLENILIDYHGDGSNVQVFPVLESADQAVTATTAGRIPKTLAKIAAGEPVKIVCWGDSVTVGGDASGPETRYTAVFANRLQAKYPRAKIDVEVVAVGGSNSRQWLWPDRFPGRPGCDWQRVVDAKPDLVTLEFVNDAGLSPADVEKVYAEILGRVRKLGAELILITPHFTMQEMMGFQSLCEKERRPYVLSVREFAEKNKIALADASARWEHLCKEGLPYTTLLRNGINHPDDRGHALFADELMKCFEPAR